MNESKPEERIDKSWVRPKEERAPSSGTSRLGLVEVDAEEEGKHSSGSKPEKEKDRQRPPPAKIIEEKPKQTPLASISEQKGQEA